jgi:hypothetical protein
MPDSTCRAEGFVVRVVDARAGFFDVCAGIWAAAAFEKRSEDQDELREEYQQ